MDGLSRNDDVPSVLETFEATEGPFLRLEITDELGTIIS